MMQVMRPPLDKTIRPLLGVARRLSLLALLSLSACSFQPEALGPGQAPGMDAAQPPDGSGPGSDGSTPDPDPALPMPRDVVHVPESAWLGSDRLVMWNDDVTIDTSTLRISGPGVAGMQDLMFESSPQQSSGPELALLYLADWTVASDVTVRVVGERPLVVISSGNIGRDGVVDAGGQGETPGAGGAGPGAGPGAGQPGTVAGTNNDSGGGGAGHATDGARGGHGCPISDSNCNPNPDRADGAPGGSLYGDQAVPVLEGGSGGGAGSAGSEGGNEPCTLGPGGAGGGAVQLYALGTITIRGGINAGGGGGTGGGTGGECNDTGGGGGGAGGVIYLQAERIVFSGTLAANGGGGGAGGGIGAPADASDGALSDAPALGGSLEPEGATADNGSSPGGPGAAGALLPGPGGDEIGETNGGGGGGASGYIVLHCTELQDTGLTSPPAFRTADCEPP